MKAMLSHKCQKPRASVALFIFVPVALVLSVMAGILLGSADLDVQTVFRVIGFKLGLQDAENLKRSAISIVWELRLPRVLLAAAAGGGLAVAGAAMQAVTQNVLADPYILGASGGASSAVALCFVLGGPIFTSGTSISASAFLGAMLSLLLVYSIGRVGSAGSGSRLVLAGMAVGMVLMAITQFLLSVAKDAYTVRNIIAWTMGSLASARWNTLAFPFFGSIIGSMYFVLNARAYNILSQGDETAAGLGVDVAKLKRVTIAVVSLITGVVVAAGGVIGFVGFIIPHIVRAMVGADHRRVFPLSFLMGGLFLTWMDILARTLFAPKELAVGMFAAFFGGPFFVWLLYRKNKYGRI